MRLHIDVCPVCAAAVSGLEEAAGDSLESFPEAAMSPGALNVALARLDVPENRVEDVRAYPDFEQVKLPPELAEIGLCTPVTLAPDTWIAHLNLPRKGGWRAYMFCGPAKTSLPLHGHDGDELIAVLEGAFSDGRDFEAGDFAENKAGFEHSMSVSAGGRMVCLIASAGPIAWRPQDRGIGVLLDI